MPDKSSSFPLTVDFDRRDYPESSANKEISIIRLPLSLTRVSLVWLAMATAMSMNGVAREVLLKRAMPPQVATAWSAVIGMALIAGITYLGFRPLGVSASGIGQLAFLSLALVLATIVFECVIGRIVDHKSWRDLLDHYAIWHGELWPLVLLWLAGMPFIWARR